jgi:hypothetical protein
MKAITLATLLICAGCNEKTGFVTPKDGGGELPLQITYTPSGCNYQVSSPTVLEAQMSADDMGPMPAPKEVHVSWAGPTSTTFAVNWMADHDTKVTKVLYGTDKAAVIAATGPATGVMQQLGHTFVYSSLFPAGETRVHEAHVCGLTPSTRYYYKVGGPGAWSDVYDVATGPTPGGTEPFRFAVTGDSRNDPTTWAQVQQAVQPHAPDFQLFSGDAVILGGSEQEWEEYFDGAYQGFKAQDVLARVPFMPSNGNHDALSVLYLSRFAVPQDKSAGEAGDGEEWYSFDYGNAHFVVLNDTTSTDDVITGAEATWLRTDLAAVNRTKTPWIIAVHHQPAYSCSTNHGSNKVIRAAWQPIFDQYKVDFVFNGHDHDYERSKPIRNFQTGSQDGALAQAGAGDIPVAESGTVYIVAAGAGAPLYGVDSSCYHTHFTESVANYVIVDVSGRTLTLTAYRLDGSVLDTFTYTK